MCIATGLAAQPVHFGELAPLTPTRYTSFSGGSVLVSNGRDLFVFWQSGHQVRVTRYTGEARAGRAVLDVDGESFFDAVWTGSGFLVAGTHHNKLVLRELDKDGDPVGEPSVVGPYSPVDLASDGVQAAVLYEELLPSFTMLSKRVLIVDRHGAPTSSPAVIENRNGFIRSAIVANGGGFTVLTVSGAGVKLTTLNAAGTITGNNVVAGAHEPGAVALATNGRGFLAAWAEYEGIVVQMIDGHGVAGNRLTIRAEASDFGVGYPAVVWNDGAYEVMYMASPKTNIEEIRRVRVDENAVIIARDAPRVSRSHTVAAAVAGGHTFLSWEESALSAVEKLLVPIVVQDATSGHDSSLVAFASMEQSVQAMATSADALLVIWKEVGTSGTTWFAGVRTSDGSFVEHPIGDGDAYPVSVASDGHGFAILDLHLHDWQVIILGPRGDILARSKPIPGSAKQIASNGDGYLVARQGDFGPYGNGIGVLRVSTSGDVSTLPVVIVPKVSLTDDGFWTLTSDGTNYLAVWQRWTCTATSCLFPTKRQILATRLDRSLRPLDVIVVTEFLEPITASTPGANTISQPSANVVIAPSEKGWTALWSNGFDTRTRTIDSNGTTSAVLKFPVNNVISVASFGDGTLGATTSTGTLAIIRNNSIVARKEYGEMSTTARIARLPGSGAAYVSTHVERETPYYGSGRVAIAIGDAVPLPSRPDAPRATAHVANNQVIVAWTAPPQRVTAYRVEYRIGDGSWIEVEASIDATTHSINALQPKSGVTYAIRVRAVNEAGAGAYSTPVIVSGRRQVVRR